MTDFLLGNWVSASERLIVANSQFLPTGEGNEWPRATLTIPSSLPSEHR